MIMLFYVIIFYYCLFNRVRAKQGVGKQVRFFQIHLRGLKVSVTSTKFGYSYSHLSLETRFPALKLTKNMFFSWKLAI